MFTRSRFQNRLHRNRSGRTRSDTIRPPDRKNLQILQHTESFLLETLPSIKDLRSRRVFSPALLNADGFHMETDGSFSDSHPVKYKVISREEVAKETPVDQDLNAGAPEAASLVHFHGGDSSGMDYNELGGSLINSVTEELYITGYDDLKADAKGVRVPADASAADFIQTTPPDTDLHFRSTENEFHLQNSTNQEEELLSTDQTHSEHRLPTGEGMDVLKNEQNIPSHRQLDQLNNEENNASSMHSQRLLSRSRKRLFRTADSFSYRRLLPFIVDLAINNDYSLEIVSCSRRPLKIAKNGDERSKIPSLKLSPSHVGARKISDPSPKQSSDGLKTHAADRSVDKLCHVEPTDSDGSVKLETGTLESAVLTPSVVSDTSETGGSLAMAHIPQCPEVDGPHSLKLSCVTCESEISTLPRDAQHTLPGASTLKLAGNSLSATAHPAVHTPISDSETTTAEEFTTEMLLPDSIEHSGIRTHAADASVAGRYGNDVLVLSVSLDDKEETTVRGAESAQMAEVLNVNSSSEHATVVLAREGKPDNTITKISTPPEFTVPEKLESGTLQSDNICCLSAENNHGILRPPDSSNESISTINQCMPQNSRHGMEIAGDAPSNSCACHEICSDEHLSELAKRIEVIPAPLASSRGSPIKSILKGKTQRCRGLCCCWSCSSFRLNAEQSYAFCRRQMQKTEEIVVSLLNELSHLRGVIQKEPDPPSSNAADHSIQLLQVRRLSKRADKAESMARSQLQKMAHDLSLHCRITKLKRQRVAFDDNVEEKVFLAPKKWQ